MDNLTTDQVCTSCDNPPDAGNGSPANFQSKLGELRSLLAELASMAPEAARETFDKVVKQANVICDDCEKKMSEATHQAMKKVKENPGQAAMIVAGAGLLAWWMLKSRK